MSGRMLRREGQFEQRPWKFFQVTFNPHDMDREECFIIYLFFVAALCDADLHAEFVTS